jgi:hypothetical protein
MVRCTIDTIYGVDTIGKFWISWEIFGIDDLAFFNLHMHLNSKRNIFNQNLFISERMNGHAQYVVER